MAKVIDLQFLTKSFFNRIFLTLIPFTILVTVIYTLIVSLSLLQVEDYILHSYLDKEFGEIRKSVTNDSNDIRLPSTSYLYSYWENDTSLPNEYKELSIGTHESLDSEYHILVDKIPGIEQRIYLVLDEDKVSSFEHYVNAIDVVLWIIAFLFVCASILTAYFIAKMIAMPVKKLAFDVQNKLYADIQFHGAERNDEIGELSRSFSSLVNQLQDSLNIEKSFTQHSSHEMRTPLAVIRNAASVLKLSNCNEEKKMRNIARIEQACIDSERMLDVFLMLGKQGENLPKEMIVIHSLIKNSLESYTELINKKEINVTIEGNIDRYIYASQSLTEAVINNLLRNALYYGKEILTININENNITITNIIDTNPSAENKYGYGLEIVNRICELNNWKIHTYSENSKFISRIDYI